MALAMQAIHAPVVPVGLQGSSQAAKPSPIAGISVLSWPMRKLRTETIQTPASPLSPFVSLLSLVLLDLARAGGLSCRISRPAIKANSRSFCACILTTRRVFSQNNIILQNIVVSFLLFEFVSCFDAESEVCIVFIAADVA